MRPSSYDFAPFKAGLYSATKTYFRGVERDVDERVYCFVLYTSGEMSSFFPLFMTEEGLDRVCAEYRQHSLYAGDTDEEIHEYLRYNPEDSSHYLQCLDSSEDLFADVNRIGGQMAAVLQSIDTGHGWQEFEDFAAKTEDAIVDVLKRLSDEGVFGTGDERNKIFVSMMMGDQDDSVLRLGRRINRPAARADFERNWAWLGEQAEAQSTESGLP
ncbi:MAG: DUF4303 domain-containing protein [Victivallales bacterium]|nr:DUF4303 domain-containing protein [Victivallales bacterium]